MTPAAPVRPPRVALPQPGAVPQERPYAAPRENRLVARDGRYYLDGQPVILRSAELQYFRVPAEQWSESIDKLRAAGCNAIASYIPWAWHEPEQGRVDFTGQTDPQRNVVRFLELVRDAGLVFLARPGPFIYAEYKGFGYPEWLADAVPEAMALRANGKPAVASHYQLYSLQHPAYMAQAERWYAAVAELLRPFLNDPVVTWQLDNETGMIYAIRVGDLDFNPDTVARYREWLRRKYRKPRVLSRRWGRRLPRFEAVTAPTASAKHVEMADWQAFYESYIAGYLDSLRGVVRRLGIDLPLTVNEAAEYLSPQDPRLKSRAADFYGYDSYTKLTGGAHTADFPFASSHHPLRFQQFAGATSPLTCWELGTGWWDWRAKVSPAATVQVFGAALAHGLKGYNLYAAQDGRDPGGYAFQFGGLLDEAGATTERYDVVARLQTFAARYQDELTASVEVQSPIAWLDYQPYTRLTPETCFPVPVPGLLEPLRYFASFAMAGFHALLQTTGYNVPFLDLETAAPEVLARSTAAVLPSCGYLDRDHYRKLEQYVLRGGHLVTFPEPVTRRADGEPLSTGVLWPHQPRTQRWLGRARLIAHLISRWMVPYYLGTRWKTARISPGALHLSDLIEPALVGQAATLPGAVLEMVAEQAEHQAELADQAERMMRGDLRVMEFPDGGDVLLRGPGGASAGYRVRVGRGSSALVGTIPGGAYVTSRYYSLSPQERLALRRFAARLFEPFVARVIVPEDALEVEVVARRIPGGSNGVSGSAGGCFLFVINRLGEQSGAIALPNPAALGLTGAPERVETLFSAFGSDATLAPDGRLQVRLAADDVLVLRLR